VVVGGIKWYFSAPAAVAIWPRGMPGSTEGDDWSTISGVLYPALDSQDKRAVCTAERE